MSLMMSELFEANRVVNDAVANCSPVAKQIACAVKERGLKRVVLAGRGSSLHAGIAFKFFLESKTPYVLSFEYPSMVTLFGAERDLSDTLYVVVSQSGAGPDTLAFAKTAKSQGALTVACTNFVDSVLAKECHYTLPISAGEEKAVAATKTLTGEIVALQVLADALAGVDTHYSTSIDNLLSYDVPEFSKELLQASQVVCLSRGMTEAVAKESGLKLTETCYLFAYASSTNEFQHGPKALIRDGLPVLLFAPDGRNRDNYVSCAKDLASKGAHLVSFTDIPEVKQVSKMVVDMPTLPENEQTVCYLVAMQKFVATYCEARGLDPDNPRNLNKVTITK
ncbi:MAG: SIS domain-containing protein [Clostridia bacterium]|nr:SIS domain-containing protein [Clostridia bacterium]